MNVLSRYKDNSESIKNAMIRDLERKKYHDEFDKFSKKNNAQMIMSLMIFSAVNLIALFLEPEIKTVVVFISLIVHMLYTNSRIIKLNKFKERRKKQ